MSEEGGNGLSVEVGLDDLDEVVESGAALGGAGGEDGPDAFGPLASALAASSLGDAPVDGHEADGLFGEVVRRLDTGRRDELEIGGAVYAQPLGHELRRPGLGHVSQRLAQDGFACLGQRRCEGGGLHRIVPVDQRIHEEFLEHDTRNRKFARRVDAASFRLNLGEVSKYECERPFKLRRECPFEILHVQIGVRGDIASGMTRPAIGT